MKRIMILMMMCFSFSLWANGEKEQETMKVAVDATLRVGIQSGPSTLDVQSETSNAAAQILYNVYDTLITRELYANPIAYKPQLAESWKQLSPTVTEFVIRKGVKFHDGSILTAEDVAYSLNRVFRIEDKRYASSNGRFFYNFDHVEVISPTVVHVFTKKPEPLLEMLLSDRCAGITSKAYSETVGLDKAALEPMGTGPYKLKEFIPKQKLTIERFDGYWGEKAPLKEIIYFTIPEIASRITALANKEVDFIVSITPDQESTFINNKSLKGVGTVWPMFHVYVLNMSHPVMQDKRLRQALNLGIDRELLVKGLWKGKGKAPVAHQFEDYGSPMYMSDLKLISYDPVKATQLVKESGYDGTPIEITIQADYYTYGDLAAQAIIEMWKKIGVNATLKQLDKYPSDQSGIMIRSWSNPLYYHDPMGAYDTHWSKASWTTSRKFWLMPNDPEWQSIYDIARFSTNVNERKINYKKLLEIGEDQSGYILLFQPYEYFVMNKNINWTIPRNYRPYTLSFRAGEVSILAE